MLVASSRSVRLSGATKRSYALATRQQQQAAAASGRIRQGHAYSCLSQARAASAAAALLRQTPASTCVPSKFSSHQHRSFTLGKPPVPVHETPHYMDFDTLVDMHMVTRQSFGDRPLFGTKKDGTYDWMTYKQFGKEVDVCRTALSRMGIARGDTVACISNNRSVFEQACATVSRCPSRRLKLFLRVIADPFHLLSPPCSIFGFVPRCLKRTPLHM